MPPSWRFASAGNGARLLICIEGQCSICLPILGHVTQIAAGEDRTHDLRIMRPTRCQLCYCRPCRLCATDYYTQQCKVWFSAQLTGELANMSRGGDRSQLLPRDLILCHSAKAIIHDWLHACLGDHGHSYATAGTASGTPIPVMVTIVQTRHHADTQRNQTATTTTASHKKQCHQTATATTNANNNNLTQQNNSRSTHVVVWHSWRGGERRWQRRCRCQVLGGLSDEQGPPHGLSRGPMGGSSFSRLQCLLDFYLIDSLLGNAWASVV